MHELLSVFVQYKTMRRPGFSRISRIQSNRYVWSPAMCYETVNSNHACGSFFHITRSRQEVYTQQTKRSSYGYWPSHERF